MANMTDRGLLASKRGQNFSYIWQSSNGPAENFFLGTFENEEAAEAVAFDIASIKMNGYSAITNFQLRYYDVEAILQSNLEAIKVLLQQSSKVQPLSSLEIQPEPKPRRLINFDIVNHENKRVSSAEIQVPETSRKKLQAWASGLSFQHGGVVSTFCSYAKTQGESQLSEEPKETQTCGFRHASRSAFRRYKGAKSDESNMQERVKRSVVQHQISEHLPPYHINYFKELELRTLDLGFRHASSSYFTPYKSKLS